MSQLYDQVQEASSTIRTLIGGLPRTAIVLGSGLGPMVERLESSQRVPYEAIPHFPLPSIAGHQGNLYVGELQGMAVAMLQGRVHFYEGHNLERVTFPIRVLGYLGISSLILTAATGGIAADLRKGDLVCVSDHINGLGKNPLRGPNDERLGKRFPDMTEVYSARLRRIAHAEASSQGLVLKPGVYYAMPGPSYETPAEIRMLRVLGADVVGMSTVPEAIVARHSGMNVLAFAMVTNAAAGVTGETIDHGEVIDVGREAGLRLGQIIERVVVAIARGDRGDEDY